jgi:hypothetical protein
MESIGPKIVTNPRVNVSDACGFRKPERTQAFLSSFGTTRQIFALKRTFVARFALPKTARQALRRIPSFNWVSPEFLINVVFRKKHLAYQKQEQISRH